MAQSGDGQTRLVPRRDHTCFGSRLSPLFYIQDTPTEDEQNNDIQDMPPTASKIPTSKMVALDQACFVQYISKSVST